MNTKNVLNIAAVVALFGAGILVTRTGRAAVNRGVCPNNSQPYKAAAVCPPYQTCSLPGGSSFGSTNYGSPSNPTFGVFAVLGSNVTNYTCIEAVLPFGINCAAFSNNAGFTGYDDTGDCNGHVTNVVGEAF